MKLYFSPLTCSLAVRIALYEAGADLEYVRINTKTKLTEHGVDYRTIHPVGMVPALLLENGQLLTEVAAILQYVAAAYPRADLAPEDMLRRARMQQWLSFIGAELQKVVYVPLLDVNAPAGAKEYALSKAEPRLAYVAQRLAGREYLVDRFSVADAFLFSILNWSLVAPVDLKPWPVLDAFMKRMHARPAVARAFAEEKEMYFGEPAKRIAVAV